MNSYAETQAHGVRPHENHANLPLLVHFASSLCKQGSDCEVTEPPALSHPY